MKKLTFLVAALCATMAMNAQITLPVSEDFAACTSGQAESSNSSMPEITDWTSFTWADSSTKVYDAGGMIKFGASSVTGSLVTKALAVVKDSVIVEFDAIGWTGTADAVTKVVVYGTEEKEITTTAADAFPITTEKMEHFRVAFAKQVDAALTIKGSATKSRFFLDNLSITEVNAGTTPTALESVEMSNIYAHSGRIYGAEQGRIYTINGMDVTEQNGQLSNGIYIVKVGATATKIAVK